MRDVLARRWVQAIKTADSVTRAQGRLALRHGVASAREHRDLLRRLAPATVLDVGANRGQFALEVRRSVPDATVISFEPLPAAADTFATVFADDPQVHLHRVALASTRGTATLHVSRADDSSSLLAIADEQARIFPGTDEVGTVEVDQTTLDDVVGAMDLAGPVMLKIDVQGGELVVLEGAPTTLGQVTWVYVECSFRELYAGQPLAAEVVEHLAGVGFGLAGLGHVTRVAGEAIQADVLFARS